MGAPARKPARITIARDADDFISQVERGAAARGSEPRLHEWVAAACERSFLARTIAHAADVEATRLLMAQCLEGDSRGPRWPAPAVVAAALEIAMGRGDERIRAWHLVLVVLQRFGIALRNAEEAPIPETADEPLWPVRSRVMDDDLVETDPPRPSPATTPRPARRRTAARPAAPPPATRPTAPPATRAPRRAPVRPRIPTPTLDQCGVDWTALAALGQLPPMVGREAEMQLLIEGLCRPAKPNVLLVGEPGVGKSALIEGLAQRIAAGTVPDALLGRPLIALNLAEITRDSRYYGVMEQRLTALIEEARKIGAILFLDEGHVMTGSGGREGTGDVASVLKPALARGDLSLITATTEDEFRRYIAPNGALERRFNVVRVLEPGRDAVREMLRAHRDAVARTHGVDVQDGAIERILERTATRLSHRREPDRSRDLLDQSIARAIAAEGSAVTADDVDATARAMSGAPEVTEPLLEALRVTLTEEGVLTGEDAADLVDRLDLAFAGLALRPQRPRAVVLLLRGGEGPDGPALAEAIAAHVFGAPERVVAIDVGGIRDATSVSGFLGTTQGYIGHGVTLPIHALAERPHAVLLLRGVDAAHESLRALLARAMRDGYLTDAQAKRIVLSSAIVVLEAGSRPTAARPLGFGAAGVAGSGDDGPGQARGQAPGAAAVESVGEDLAGACDVIAVPPRVVGGAAGSAWVARALGRLAVAYRAVGLELAWDADAVAVLGALAAGVPDRDRERRLESAVGRAVRPCLRTAARPVRARLQGGSGGLAANVEDPAGQGLEAAAAG